MSKLKRHFGKLALVQVGIFIVALSVWFFITTRSYLAAPTDGDLYAHTWSFQVLNFCVFYFPPCVCALALLLLTEWLLLRLLNGKHVVGGAGLQNLPNHGT